MHLPKLIISSGLSSPVVNISKRITTDLSYRTTNTLNKWPDGLFDEEGDHQQEMIIMQDE